MQPITEHSKQLVCSHEKLARCTSQQTHEGHLLANNSSQINAWMTQRPYLHITSWAIRSEVDSRDTLPFTLVSVMHLHVWKCSRCHTITDCFYSNILSKVNGYLYTVRFSPQGHVAIICCWEFLPPVSRSWGLCEQDNAWKPKVQYSELTHCCKWVV